MPQEMYNWIHILKMKKEKVYCKGFNIKYLTNHASSFELGLAL
jgi:hypothetical protein